MTTAEAVSQLQSIPLDKIQPSPYQTRKQFDEEKLKELAQTLKDHGLLNAIVVRPVGDRYELVSGERRLRAARLLGWDRIEAKIEAIDDREAAEQVLVENLQREDLNPIEQAEGYKKLKDMGLNQEEIAKKVGCVDRTKVARFLALLELPAEIQQFVSQDTISEAHIRYLGRIKDKAELIKTARQAANQGWSVKETERRVLDLLEKTHIGTGNRPEPPADPLAKGWETLMSNPDITPGSWSVHSRGIGQWTLTLHTPGITPVADMTRWLKAALEAIGSIGPDVSINPAIKIKATTDPSAPEVTLNPEFAPQNEAELLQAEADGKNQRLPKNQKEEAELLALAPQGPAAVYQWIWGPESFYLKTVKGKTWKDLGYADPQKAVHEMVDGLKKLEADLRH